jgi:hypothetical protein
MPPKHPYVDDTSKGAFLALINKGDALLPAAKKAKINPKTARAIKRRADKITVYCNNNNLPPPPLSKIAARNNPSVSPLKALIWSPTE